MCTVAVHGCTSNLWCKDCIQASKNCAWCEDKEFHTDRCNSEEELLAKSCQKIFHPQNNKTNTRATPLFDGDASRDPIQVLPQEATVSLRTGQAYKVDMTYKVARNLPMDMYFVLDFSTTMSQRLGTLADLTNTLISHMRSQFTENIHIGFGSFLDKKIQPFSHTTRQYLENPCTSSDKTMKCDPSHGFKHKYTLNSNVAEFTRILRLQNTSANNDPAEGGLDAVIQASVCTSQIGWRNQSRRVLVYISDSAFHFSGDGKLAGIDKPNDEQCHLVKTQSGDYEYSESTSQDYPSLGQVRSVLTANNINAFFVVAQDSFVLYQTFTDTVKQAETRILDVNQADDIVKTIVDFYNKLDSKVEFQGMDIPDELDVKLISDCGSGNVKNTANLKQQSFVCDKVQKDQPVNFTVELRALRCPDPNMNKTIIIKPVGLQESLQLQVSFICDCNCFQSQELDDEKCSNGNGTYECGACRCKPGRSGNKCQCDSESDDDIEVQEFQCKKNNDTDIKCENQGVCRCGQCDCFKNYEGKYCECDTNRCINDADPSAPKCTSPDHGTCQCNRCYCNEGYQGMFCECPTDDVCRTENGLTCNGHGTCECGECKRCKNGYSGPKCEDCPTCDRCRVCGQESCVKCLAARYNETSLRDVQDCPEHCSGVKARITVEIFKNENGTTIQTPCGIQDPADSHCEMKYIVNCDSEDRAPTIYIARKSECIYPPNALYVALPILAGIIGVGLLLLIIWRILTSFYDKIEYARFEHEIKNPKWSRTDNPIYNSPVTSNENPNYQPTQ